MGRRSTDTILFGCPEGIVFARAALKTDVMLPVCDTALPVQAGGDYKLDMGR